METKKKAKAKKTEDKTRVVTVRLPADLYDEVHKMADRDTRTFNLQVTHLLKRGIAAEKSSDK